MDKVIKLNSKQGGGFTATNNLVDFDIPPDGAYDLSRSYVNLVCNVTDPALGDWGEPQAAAAVNTNLLTNYLVKYADIAATPSVPVMRPQIEWIDADRLSLYNAALVKNCSMDTERQGSLEDIRRVDVLRQNLNEYVLTEEQKRSLEYSSIRQLADVNKQVSSLFTEVNSTGDVRSRALTTRIPIKLNQLFELGNVAKFPADKMGKVRMHLELNLDKIRVAYYSNFPQFSSFQALVDTNNPPQYYGPKYYYTDDRYITPAGNVDSLTSYTVLNHEFPFYVGQLVRISGKFTNATAVAAKYCNQNMDDDAAAQVFAITHANLPPDAGNVAYTAFQLTLAGANLTEACDIVIAGLVEGTPITETVRLPANTHDRATGQYFQSVSSITKLAGPNPNNAGLNNATITIGYSGNAIKSSFGVIKSVAVNDADAATNPSRTVVTFDTDIGDFSNATAGSISLDDLYCNPQTAVSLPIYGTIKVEMAELVLHKLGNPGKTPNKLQYMSFSTEQFTTTLQQNFQRMFQLEPEAVNVLIMFPSGNADLFSNMTTFTADLAGGSRYQIDKFRLRLDNDDLMNRNVKPYDPLYYDRLNMTFMNMGYKLRNVHEWASRIWLDPQLNPETQRDTYNVTANQKNGALRSLIISNPVPATKQEKQLQVNIDCKANYGIEKLCLFKQVMRSVGL